MERKALITEIAKIYRKSGGEAKEYLCGARKLKETLGSGPTIVYCWFYSVPQKWIQVESKFFELLSLLNSFELETILTKSTRAMARTLKPMIFYNEISSQLKNFASAVHKEYSTWDNFADSLTHEEVFTMFDRLRKYKNIRLTFKNLSAMKIFVGTSDDLLILDTHVGRTLGLSKNEIDKCRIRKSDFKNLLEISDRITCALKTSGFDVTTVIWSLAIWFDKTKTLARELLPSKF